MNAKEFFAKYDGKGVDYDGSYGNQCVDVALQYGWDVLGLKRWGSGNAKGRWVDYPTDSFDRIDYKRGIFPIQGDVVIWHEWAGNEFGHISVAKEGNISTFVSFDQNWPVGSLCHSVTHNYNNVLGWLRPKRQDLVQGDDMSAAERQELNQLRVFRDEVKANKVNEFRLFGASTVYQIYAIPSMDHFNFLGNAWENIRDLPADYPTDPAIEFARYTELAKAKEALDKSVATLEANAISDASDYEALQKKYDELHGKMLDVPDLEESRYQEGYKDGIKYVESSIAAQGKPSLKDAFAIIADFIKNIIKK